METKTAYTKAQRILVVFNRSAGFAIGLITFTLIVLIKIPTEVHTVAGDVPNPAWGVLAAIIATMVALLALPIARASAEIALLQMEQAEEQRSTHNALANAIEELTKEMRRRPNVSSSV